MRGGQQRTDLAQAILAEQVDHGQDAGVLADDMPGPARTLVAEAIRGGLDIGHGGIAQGREAEDLGRLLAGLAPFGVGTLAEGVGDAGVDHEQAEPGGVRIERDLLGGQGAGVQQQDMPGGADHGGHLVHDPARDADDLVLGTLGEEGQAGRIARPTEQVAGGQHGRALYCRTRR